MFRSIIFSFSAFLFIWLTGCSSPDRPQSSSPASNGEFEGVITYHEISKTNDGRINIDDTVQLYYANGNYVGVHSAKAPGMVAKDYYFWEKPLRLLLFNSSDTLNPIALEFPIEKLDSFKVKKAAEKVLLKDCETVNMAISYAEQDHSISYTDISYTFSRGFLQVDTNHFKNWHLGFFNKVIDETGCFYLNFKTTHYGKEHKTVLSGKSYDVISVKAEAVDPQLFAIDTTKIKPVQ